MGQTRLVKAGLAALLLLCCVAIGAVITFFVVHPADEPASLPTPAAAGLVPAVSQGFTDSQPVDVSFAERKPVSLYAPAGGVVTKSTCAADSTMRSGTSTFSIDGRAILSLATSVPLWRDLTPGISGADVAAFKQALTVLGQPVSSGDRLGAADLKSFGKILAAAGGSASSDRVSLADLVWIPDRSMVLSSCTVSTGQRVAAGAVLAAAGTDPKISLEDLPQGLLPGPRALRIDGVRVPVTASGALASNANPLSLLATASYRKAVGQAPTEATVTVPGTLVLTKPVRVVPLPATSIKATSATEGCVRDGTQILAVRIVGSEVGSTLVMFQDGTPVPATVRSQGPGRCG